MARTSLIAALLSDLSLRLTPLGFDPRLRMQEWSRKQPHGANILHANIASHGGEFDVLVSASIRIDAVEKLVKPDSSDTATIGTFLENLAGLPAIHHRVSSMGDVPLVAQKVVNLVVAHGEPFFARFSSPSQMLDLLMSSSDLATRCSLTEGYRAMNVCALLILDGRGIEASEYVRRRLPEIRKWERERVIDFARTLGLAV